MAEVYTINHNKRRSFFGSFRVNTILIALNVIFFIIFTILISVNEKFIAINPSSIFAGQYLWTFLTSMFMHAGFAHLFFNMFSLFFIGTVVERIIGRKRYLWFYLVSGIFAGLFFVTLSFYFGNSEIGARIFGDPNVLGVGASGAIFGLVGLLAVLIPYSKVYLILGPLIAIIADSLITSIPALAPIKSVLSVLISVYLFVSIFAIFSFSDRFRKIAVPVGMPFWLLPLVAIIPLIIIGLFVSLPIGNTAHLGGFLVGIFYGIYLRTKYKKKTSMLSKYFS